MTNKKPTYRFLARNKFGTLRIYENEPTKTEEGFWYNDKGHAYTLRTDLFPEVTYDKGVFTISIQRKDD